MLSVNIGDTALALPKGFVYLETIDPSIIQDMRYAGCDNFVGKPVPGYQTSRCIMTRKTAIALSKVQNKLKPFDLSLKILDAYRPQKASNYFISWAQDDQDQKMKARYYPNIKKSDLFKKGYIAPCSAHTRGSTVDVTLVMIPSCKNAKPTNIEMGTLYDYFDSQSHTVNDMISHEILTRRLYLKALMEAAGFKSIKTEWWHFTLQDEPYPDSDYDFDIQ